MKIHRSIALFLSVFLTAGIAAAVFLPKEPEYNSKAEIKIGAGDDISGILMQETIKYLDEKYQITQSVESSAFQDCCSNTAQWALNAKEINLGFYCANIAKYTVEHNQDVEIYGPVIMNAEMILYRGEWDNVKTVGIMQGREQFKRFAEKTYPQIEKFDEITQKGILYAMEDGQVDAAVLDITKAAGLSQISYMPLARNDYISYVLVADKEFAKTEAFRDFLTGYQEAVKHLRERKYLSEVLGVEEDWLQNTKMEFLDLEETGEE